MSISRCFICAFSFVVLLNLQAIPSSSVAETEDLVNEYYTIISGKTDQITDQDRKDAQEIWDSDKSDSVLASILLNRDKNRRYAINEEILKKIVGKNANLLRKHKWITPYYTPQPRDGHKEFRDLCFGLIEDDNVVLGRYLSNFFDKKERTWIVIAMTLTKDMEQMIKTYDENPYESSFKDGRKSQKKPFENMLRVWVRYNRDQIENGLDNEAIKKDAELLKIEHDGGCWQEDRGQVELITMQKSIPYARAVFEAFEMSNGNKTIESIIDCCVQSEGLDWDLGNAYTSLVRYIKNKYNYIASTLHDNSDESNWLPAWVMCVTVVHAEEWREVDKAFQNLYKSEATSLSDFIMKKVTQNKIMAEAIAVIVDSKFKPTTFKWKSDGNPGHPPPPPPA